MLDTQTSHPVIVMADGDQALSKRAQAALVARGLRVTTADSGDSVLALVDDASPDVVLLDPSLRTEDGEDVLDVLKAEAGDNMPVVVLTTDEPSVLLKALDLGAHDHISRSFDDVSLTSRVEAAIRTKQLRDEVNRQRTTLSRLARVDTLTGLGNRTQMEQLLVQAAATAARHDRPLSLILMDIDQFTKINDSAGTEAGDFVLQDVARHVAADIRTGDAAARWDGDQFLLLLPETPVTGAAVLAERLRITINEFGAQLADGTTRPITVSLGCAEGDEAGSMLRQAASRLTDAKRAGGNTVRR